ncbi:UDP-N-acetylmuramoyl-L-alanyl-D-glutamate--2,6-diaminopimelate ligase [Silvanigrella aquatica]|uniref:UDP-N-acetylmuramoyl-L-alanyl-D-glutamate--2,6-diaminopimelate ligase n=1 Tax=Silvanigrella aquatica TaxID=1915309 RepID=A0A1L4CWY8_9BACT|nr:UDP-N-acetylmuramoyl-L-alanyl-D-glutamate--2,6-diaminopimelate ligase [Silvanigrella aquatica]APJ02462.1 hypothetical protein AXG55_00340 [Silvanigrella aquatica]
MSLPLKLELPLISLKEVIVIFEQFNLIIKNKPSLSKNTKKFNLIINSKDLNSYSEKKNEYKKNSFIYIARAGKKFDGHLLAEDILNSDNYIIGNPENIKILAFKHNYSNEKIDFILSHENFIPVHNIEKSIYILLENQFKIEKNNFFSIGVTGTNGKTSVVQICSQILSILSNNTNVRIGTLGIQFGSETLEGSHVTTPDYPSLLQILNLSQINNISDIIMEVTSHGLMENRLGNWSIDAAIFTNLTQDHLDYHGNMENYRNAKLKLFTEILKETGTAIICTHNSEWKEFAQKAAGSQRKLIGVGFEDNAEHFISLFDKKYKSLYYISITNQKSSLSGVSGVLRLQNQLQTIETAEFHAAIIGEFQFDNLLCAIAACLSKGYSLREISQTLKHIKNIPGRLEIIHSNNKNKSPTVLIDYAHSPDALEKAIQVCKKVLNQEGRGKLITVFGCGGDRDKTKRSLMGQIASSLSDEVIITSDNPRTEEPNKIIDDIFAGIVNQNHCKREVDRKKAIQLAIHSANKFDLILVAGKGHEDYQIIGNTKYPFSDAQIALSILHGEN